MKPKKHKKKRVKVDAVGAWLLRNGFREMSPAEMGESELVAILCNSPIEAAQRLTNTPTADPKPISENVLNALTHERAYQERKWPEHKHSVAEWLILLEGLCLKARQAWVKGGNPAALDEIRQLTASGIACMEQCGASHRCGDGIVGSKSPHFR